MKSCPECNRTFEDTFTFCLIDGSVLSAPIDPLATQTIPEPRQTEPPPTEVLKLEETKQEIKPTIASPQSEQKPEEVVSTIAAPTPKAELSHRSSSSVYPARKSKLLPLVTTLAVILAMLVIALLINSNRNDKTNEGSGSNANAPTSKPPAEDFVVTIKGVQSEVWVKTRVDEGKADDRLIKPGDEIQFRPQKRFSILLPRSQVMNINVLINGRMADLEGYQQGMGATAGIYIDKDSYEGFIELKN